MTFTYSRDIQNQIAKAQKQLQELSSNEDMTLEEKMKKRQEIQQQISNLNMQLKQHQMEQRREAQNRLDKQQAKASSMDDMRGTKNKAESKSTGLSQTNMTAMISADSSIKQAKVQGSVVTEMKGKAGVLESEIKLDRVRGNDTQAKEELAEVKQKAQAAATSQLSTLADASKTMEKAAKVDSKTEYVDNKDTGVKEKDAKELNQLVLMCKQHPDACPIVAWDMERYQPRQIKGTVITYMGLAGEGCPIFSQSHTECSVGTLLFCSI